MDRKSAGQHGLTVISSLLFGLKLLIFTTISVHHGPRSVYEQTVKTRNATARPELQAPRLLDRRTVASLTTAFEIGCFVIRHGVRK